MKNLFENWNKFIVEQDGMETSTQTFDLKLPKLRISEQWGTPGTDDRKIVEMFTSKIKGSSLSEKISAINSFVGDCDKACASTKDVSEILGNLVFLDSLASVIYDFNPMTGGFLFESIISALLGGKSRQVTTGGEGSGQAVVDIYDESGRPLSLKFFFEGASQYIHGSYDNLKRDIIKEGQPMVYLIGIKNRSHEDGRVLAVDFYEFTVGVYDADIGGDWDVSWIGYGNGLPVGDVIGRKARGRAPKGEEGKPRQRQKKTSYYLGTINLGDREEIKKVAQNYADRLGSVLYEIYDQIDSLSKNVNEYFLEAPQAKESALRAQQNAIQLRKDTEDLT